MGKAREVWHTVQADDDVQWVAASYGIKDWQAVYADPKNKPLADKRKDPHVLYAGDQIWIPDLKPKVFEAETDKQHEYVLYPPKQLVHIELIDGNGKPHGNRRYEIWIDGTHYPVPGTAGELRTRADGLIHHLVPLSRDIEIRAWISEREAQFEHEALEPSEQDPEEFDYISLFVHPAHLDPIETVEGVQDRLRNLGYDFDAEWGSIGHGTRDAIREFQRDTGLTQSGEIDDETRKRLLETAGA